MRPQEIADLTPLSVAGEPPQSMPPGTNIGVTEEFPILPCITEVERSATAKSAIRWIQCLSIVGVVLGFTAVVLGAYVRLTSAGLGCPDWPGCYGHVTPLGVAPATTSILYAGRPFVPGKAWREMIHRYAAGTLTLVIVLITALALAARRRQRAPVGLALSLSATVIVQAMLGMLTVTWQLTPLIVTLHLLFGLTTLALLWWLLLSMSAPNGQAGAYSLAGRTLQACHVPPRTTATWLLLAALVVLASQVALGGWTSSNYAALACPDFPTCQGAWWPQADFKHAFVLWRPLNIDYEGGVLANPSRVAIHFSHRLGALSASIALAGAALFALRRQQRPDVRRMAWTLLVALCLQLLIGSFMVLEAFPLWLATAHTAGAALLLLATLGLLRSVSRR